MDCTALYKLYRKVPSFFAVLDKTIYSEPFIEKFSTFEMKTFLSAYSIVIGVYFDKRAKKSTRRIVVTYYLAGSLIVYISTINYFMDLRVYDVESLAMPILVMSVTAIKFVFWWFNYCFYHTAEHVDFFIADYDGSNGVIISEEIRDDGSIKVKKWVILVVSIFFGFYIAGNVFFDPENDTKVTGLTERPYLMKFCLLWCPFENLWLKRVMSLLQDAIFLPELFMNVAGIIAMLVTLIEMHNKFQALLQKMKLTSERTFERMDLLDKGLEETTCLENARIRSRDMKCLDEEQIHTMEMCNQDLISYVKRYQQLHRIQRLIKNHFDCLYSCVYCFTSVCSIGFGFIWVEAFSNPKFGFEYFLKILIWFFGASSIWLLYCVVGNLFSEQNDSFSEQVYSMPWYYFSPKQRTTVLTLLKIMEKPTTLQALKFVDVNKDTFPRFLDAVYSYVQIMRTLQHITHRRT